MITQVRYLGEKDNIDPNTERVQFSLARGAKTSSVDIGGYQLRNNAEDRFVFPNKTILKANKPIAVYSGKGDTTNDVFYWGHTKGVWNNKGDCAYLYNAHGERIDGMPATGGKAQRFCNKDQ